MSRYPERGRRFKQLFFTGLAIVSWQILDRIQMVHAENVNQPSIGLVAGQSNEYSPNPDYEPLTREDQQEITALSAQLRLNREHLLSDPNDRLTYELLIIYSGVQQQARTGYDEQLANGVDLWGSFETYTLATFPQYKSVIQPLAGTQTVNILNASASLNEFIQARNNAYVETGHPEYQLQLAALTRISSLHANTDLDIAQWLHLQAVMEIPRGVTTESGVPFTYDEAVGIVASDMGLSHQQGATLIRYYADYLFAVANNDAEGVDAIVAEAPLGFRVIEHIRAQRAVGGESARLFLSPFRFWLVSDSMFEKLQADFPFLLGEGYIVADFFPPELGMTDQIIVGPETVSQSVWDVISVGPELIADPTRGIPDGVHLQQAGAEALTVEINPQVASWLALPFVGVVIGLILIAILNSKSQIQR